MDIFDRIAAFEAAAPARYLESRVLPWGRIFWDKTNPESYCSNYAVITGGDPGQALVELEDFYGEAGLLPKVFYRGGSLPLERLRPFFTERDYHVKEFSSTLMTWSGYAPRVFENVPVKYWEQPLTGAEYALEVEQDNGQEFGIRLINRQLAGGCRIYFAYDNQGKPVSQALVEPWEDLVYISDVYTTPAYRRKGLAEALIRIIQRDYWNKKLYLVADEEGPIRLYERMGFTGRPLNYWWAFKGQLPPWLQEE